MQVLGHFVPAAASEYAFHDQPLACCDDIQQAYSPSHSGELDNMKIQVRAYGFLRRPWLFQSKPKLTTVHWHEVKQNIGVVWEPEFVPRINRSMAIYTNISRGANERASLKAN
jgi:hypothetical protein